MGPIAKEHYFDVVDIDQYDAILGTVFCREHGVLLDFGRDQVVVRGTVILLFQEPIVVKDLKNKRPGIHHLAMAKPAK